MSDEAAATAAAVAQTTQPAVELPPPTLFEQLAGRFIARAKAEEVKLKDKAITKYGVTRAMLADFLHQDDASWAELETVTEDTARKILFDRYWMPLAADKLPAPVASAVFDLAIRRGVSSASKLLQRALTKVEPVALKIDGKVREQTLGAIEHLEKAGRAIELGERVLAERTTFIFKLLDGKLFGRDLDIAGAALAVGRAALLAKTGIRL